MPEFANGVSRVETHDTKARHEMAENAGINRFRIKLIAVNILWETADMDDLPQLRSAKVLGKPVGFLLSVSDKFGW
jgi:hypothetical protein